MSGPISCLKENQRRDQIRSSWKSPEGRDCTTAFHNLLHCLAVLRGRVLPNIHQEFPVSIYALLSLVLLLWTAVKSPAQSLPSPPCGVMGVAIECPWSHVCSRLEKPRPCRFCLQGKRFSHQLFQCPPLNLLQFVSVFVVLTGAQLDAVFLIRSNDCQVEWLTPPLICCQRYCQLSLLQGCSRLTLNLPPTSPRGLMRRSFVSAQS